MAQACPVNFTTIDSHAGRIGSALTLLLVVSYIASGNVAILFFLTADLLVRLYGDKAFSPVSALSSRLMRLLRLGARPVDGAAKHVAGHFGLLFSVLLIVTHFLHADTAAYAVAAVFGLCLLMDAVFNFCVGCKIYRFYLLLRSV